MKKEDYIWCLRYLSTELWEQEHQAESEDERDILWAKRKFVSIEYERVMGIIPDFEIDYPEEFAMAIFDAWLILQSKGNDD